MRDTDTRARTGVSREALEILSGSDAIDTHVESFVWTRLLGYDLARRHGRGPLRGWFLSQLDIPRLMDSGLTGAVWSIATNPYRRRGRQTDALVANVARLRAILEAAGVEVVRDAGGYARARSRGRHAAWIAVQGGNALGRVEDLERIADDVCRITLVHMTDSRVGATSNMPGYRGVRGLTAFGRDLVRAMDASGVLVDLAHASERTFWDALEVHDRSRPAIVSHTGLKGVFDTPRNITDRQLKAIADTGGVVGIIAHSWALRSVVRRCTARDIVAHMEHAIRVAGDDFVALGNDWDGLIVTPPDMRTVDRLPLLVERMLGRGFAPERIRKILGLNFLRLLGGHSPTM